MIRCSHIWEPSPGGFRCKICGITGQVREPTVPLPEPKKKDVHFYHPIPGVSSSRCGYPGPVTSDRDKVTCIHCRRILHMKLLKEGK